MRPNVANQAAVDKAAAELLRKTFCDKHHWALRRYANDEYGCPECEWDRYLEHENDLEPYPDIEPEERAI